MALVGGTPGAENPSPAYLAGAQHGAALAQQHAAARAAAPKVRTPAAAAQTAPGTLTLNDMLAQAQQIAQQQTNQQVAAIKAQQGLYDTQAQQRAQQEVAASQAAAQLLANLGLGNQAAQSYTQAAQALGGLAQGFSGQTATDATNAANQVAAQAAALGAPAGSVQTSTGQTSQPAALGNVLYSLGGFIPGNLLLTEGQAAAAQQRGLPANFLEYGNQMAGGELAAGQSNADALTQNILNARAQEPSLYQSILSSLGQQATNSALAQSLIGSRAVTGQVAQQNASTNRFKATTAAAYDQGRLAQSAAATAAKANKPPSAATEKYLNGLASTLYNGTPPKYEFKTVTDPKTGQKTSGWYSVPGTGTKAVQWNQAVNKLVAAGASRKKAVQLLNAQGWAPGEGGRPTTVGKKWTANAFAAQNAANAAAQAFLRAHGG